MNDSQASDGQPPLAYHNCTKRPLFQLGQLVSTPGALRTLEEFSVSPASLIFGRHVIGDWGDLCEEDCQANTLALQAGARIFSAYELKRHDGNTEIVAKVWIITEANRAVTTILLPDEY